MNKLISFFQKTILFSKQEELSRLIISQLECLGIKCEQKQLLAKDDLLAIDKETLVIIDGNELNFQEKELLKWFSDSVNWFILVLDEDRDEQDAETGPVILTFPWSETDFLQAVELAGLRAHTGVSQELVTDRTEGLSPASNALPLSDLYELLFLAIEQSATMVIITNHEGVIVYVNSSFLNHTGYVAGELIGQHVRILKSGQQEESFYKQMWDLLHDGQTWSGEFHNRRKDGSLYWERSTISPVRTSWGETVYYLSLKTDVSAEKEHQQMMQEKELKLVEAKEEAISALESKSGFLSFISHEIRTPLNAVISIANLLSQTPLNTEQKELADVLTYSSNNLMALINDVLDLSKMDAGKFQFEAVAVDLNQMCSRIVASYQPKAREKSLGLAFFPLPERCRIKTDVLRLTQVLNNLLNNALKFTVAGGVELSLNAEKAQEPGKIRVSFSVKDSGIGISAQKLDYIFEPYTQEKAMISRAFGGTGLGLSISQKIIMALGGKIQVKSREGEGSVFSFTLEFEEARASEPLSDAKSLAEKMPDLQLLKVLLVEDNQMNILIMEKFFSKWKLSYRVAKDGRECFEWLERESYDLLLLDVYLPDMDGFEIAKTIRLSKKANTRKVGIIGLTAAAEPEIREKAMAAGMNDLVVKPFKPEVLAGKMAMFLLETKTKIIDSGNEPQQFLTRREFHMKKLVDIEAIRDIAGEDMDIFVQTIVFSLETLRTEFLDGFYKKDTEKIKLARHNLYPTMRNFGMERLEALIESHKQMQEKDPEGGYNENAEAVVLEIAETCKEIVQYLEEQV